LFICKIKRHLSYSKKLIKIDSKNLEKKEVLGATSKLRTEQFGKRPNHSPEKQAAETTLASSGFKIGDYRV